MLLSVMMILNIFIVTIFMQTFVQVQQIDTGRYSMINGQAIDMVALNAFLQERINSKYNEKLPLKNGAAKKFEYYYEWRAFGTPHVSKDVPIETKSFIDTTPDLLQKISEGEIIISDKNINLVSYFEQKKQHLIYFASIKDVKNVKAKYSINEPNISSQKLGNLTTNVSLEEYLYMQVFQNSELQDSGGYTMFFFVTPTQEYQKVMMKDKEHLDNKVKDLWLKCFTFSSSLLVLSIICIILYVFSIDVKRKYITKLNELLLIGLISSGMFSFYILVELGIQKDLPFLIILDYFYIAVVTVAQTGVGIAILTYWVKQIKQRRFFKNFMIVQVYQMMEDFFVFLLQKGNKKEKSILKIIFYVLTAFLLIVGAFFVIILMTPRSIISILIFLIFSMITGYFTLKNIQKELNKVSDDVQIARLKQQKAEQTKLDLITNVSHDLKTPLTAIMNYSELLNQEENEEKMKQQAQVILQKGRQLERLITDVVELSKVANETQDLHLDEINIQEFMEQIIAEFEQDFPKGIQFLLVIDDSISTLHTDVNKLLRIIYNLFENVQKYAKKGTICKIMIEADDCEMSIVITNQFQGEMEVSSDQLRERFVRGNSERSSAGHGLGLAITDILIKNLGGVLVLAIENNQFIVKIFLPKYIK